MNLTKVAAWSEIVSSVAILATLGYLAVQVEQNTSSIHAQSRQAMLGADLEILHTWSTNQSIAMGLAGQGELSDAEALTVYFAFGAFMRSRENYWLQYQNGVIDQATWEAYRNPIGIMLSGKRAREYWGMITRGHDDSFVAQVNKLIEGEPTTEFWDQILAVE